MTVYYAVSGLNARGVYNDEYATYAILFLLRFLVLLLFNVLSLFYSILFLFFPPFLLQEAMETNQLAMRVRDLIRMVCFTGSGSRSPGI